MSGEFESIADVATGGLVAHAMTDASNRKGSDHGGCANCGSALIGPHCHQCGQSGHVHRTASALFHDIAHGVFHLEGRTWHTLPLLFWKPGELTRRYVQGERVKFVSPMALFLFSVFLMVATFSLMGSLTGRSSEALAAARMTASVELSKANTRLANLKVARDALREKGASTEVIDEQITEISSDIAGLRLVTTGQINPDIGREVKFENVTLQTGFAPIDRIVSHATKNPELTLYKLQTSAYKFSWALIPISLPFIWVMFAFRRDVGMYDHAIFATYSLSAMSILVILLWLAAAAGVWPALLWTILLLFPPWHMYRQLRGAYRLSRFGALWRTLFLVISAYTAASIFFATLLLIQLKG